MTWWRHQMETFSALLALCAGNSPVSGEFPAQRPVTRSFDVFFDLRLIKQLSKHSRGWWFETLSRPLWRHCNGCIPYHVILGYVIITPDSTNSSQHGQWSWGSYFRWHFSTFKDKFPNPFINIFRRYMHQIPFPANWHSQMITVCFSCARNILFQQKIHFCVDVEGMLLCVSMCLAVLYLCII